MQYSSQRRRGAEKDISGKREGRLSVPPIASADFTEASSAPLRRCGSKQGLFGLMLALLLAWGVPAGAVQVQGGKPLTRAEDALRGERGAAAEVVMLHGVVDTVEVDVGVVTINGLRFAMAGVPLHGPAGNLNLRDLLPGSRVRIALGGPPNQRRLLELWLLGANAFAR